MRDQMLAAIRCVEYLKRFNGREYGKAYKEYVQAYGPVFMEAVPAAGEEAGGDELLNGMVEDLLNALEAGWKAERIWNRSAARTSQKQMIIFYLSPMLLGLEEPACARLAELLRDGWAARWPKSAYEIADYKTIRKGFQNVVLGVNLDRLSRVPDDED